MDSRCSTTSSLGSCLKFLTNFFCLVRLCCWGSTAASSESESCSAGGGGGEGSGGFLEAVVVVVAVSHLVGGWTAPARPMLAGGLASPPGHSTHLRGTREGWTRV